MEIIIAIVNTSINAKEFGTTGLAAKLLTLDDQKRGELIQDTIMNLTCDQITELMHKLGAWEENTILAEYSPEEIGRLVQIGNDAGFDVHLEIERGRDYYLFAKEIKQRNYFSTYRITGHIDTFDEIGGLMDIWGVVGSILGDSEKMQIFLDYMEKIEKS